ncbi:MAG: amidohydrolase family protein [Gammaproteobacteria bacterium]
MFSTILKRRAVIGALIGGAAAAVNGSEKPRADDAKPASRIRNKITLEEHFVLPSSLGTTFHPPGIPAAVWSTIEARLLDVDEQRLPQMNDNGIQMQVVSLSANGIQGEVDPKVAVDRAKAANDWLVKKFVGAHPTRFAGFAAVALQDPQAAAREAERAVTQLGLKGVLINGYSNLGDENHAEYLDLPKFFPFWERVEDLGVPVYLHPRTPLPSQRLIYDGHEEMIGPMWAFGAETAVHALRLMTSGIFDRFPRQQVILGHAGEGLVAMMARAQRRFEYAPCGKSLRKPLGQYLRDHFHITMSGNFHTPTLNNVIEEMGVDRVMFSVDYPYESMLEGASWFDGCAMEEQAKLKIGRSNALRLLRLNSA